MKRVPEDGIYVYSFNLNLDITKHQPNGACNFSFVSSKSSKTHQHLGLESWECNNHVQIPLLHMLVGSNPKNIVK